MAQRFRDEQATRLAEEGRLLDAAQRLQHIGETGAALGLYESIFAYEQAAALAEQLGDRPRALANLLDGRCSEPLARLREALNSGTTEEIVRAAEIFALRRAWSDAAELYELAAEPAKAAEFWKKHGDLSRAGKRYEEAGEFRKAGECYEQHLREVPDDTEASLRIGRILLRFRHYDEAITHLQKAVEQAGLRAAALETLVRAFDAAGLGSAARDSFAALRALRPELPARCEEYLRELRRSEEERAEERLLLGRYRMGKLLGSGGTARVYLAVDEFSGREVALKIFSGEGAKGREVFQRFVREAKIVAALSHPNVVRVFEFHPQQGFLVMEYMAGGTLEDRLQPDLPLRQITPALKAIVEGLDAAHRRGIIHRDIKPANIFYGAAGEVKLGDFGVAHLQDLGATQTGGFIGTLAYMAPEQVTGAPLSVAADQYALGVTLYRMLTGLLPFDGPDVAAQHLSRAAIPPSERRAGLPPAVDGVVLRALEKDPAARFPTIRQLLDAFSRIDVDVAPSPALPVLPSVPAAAARQQGPRYVDHVPQEAPEGLRREAARDARLDRWVLLERPAQEEEAERWRQQIASLARATDPALETLLGIEEGAAVFERVEGETLGAEIARGPLAAERALSLVEEVARGVSALHAVGAVHGSIAAEVIVLTPSPVLLLTRRRFQARSESSGEDVLALGNLLVSALGGGAQEDPWAEAAALLGSELTEEGARRLREVVSAPPTAAAQAAAIVRFLAQDARLRARRMLALSWSAALAAEVRGDGALRRAQEVIRARAQSWGLPESVAAELLRTALPVRRG